MEQGLSFSSHCFPNSGPVTCQSRQEPMNSQVEATAMAHNAGRKLCTGHHSGKNEGLTAEALRTCHVQQIRQEHKPPK